MLGEALGKWLDRWRRNLALCLLVWLLLTCSGAILHWAVWTGRVHDGGILKPLANLEQTVIGPGWVTVRVIMGRRGMVHPASIAAASALGWMMILVGLFLADGLRGVLPTFQARSKKSKENPVPVDLSRRRAIVNGSFAIVGVGAMSSGVKGALIDPWSLQIRRYTIPIRGLDSSLDGFRIVQISDTHLGPRISASFIEDVVARAIGLQPDLFVLTGDYIHHGEQYIEQAAKLVEPLTRATTVPGSVIGVLGNHDWYGNGPVMSQALRDVGVAMIDNACVFIERDKTIQADVSHATALCIAGLGDLLEDAVNPDAALGHVPQEVPRIILAHHPDTAEHLVSGIYPRSHRMDLMLSGHTHGGQVRLPLIGCPIVPSNYGQKYAGGLVEGPECPVIVSRGIGMSILPIRFGVPPELVEITLSSVPPD